MLDIALPQLLPSVEVLISAYWIDLQCQIILLDSPEFQHRSFQDLAWHWHATTWHVAVHITSSFPSAHRTVRPSGTIVPYERTRFAEDIWLQPPPLSVPQRYRACLLLPFRSKTSSLYSEDKLSHGSNPTRDSRLGMVIVRATISSSRHSPSRRQLLSDHRRRRDHRCSCLSTKLCRW